MWPKKNTAVLVIHGAGPHQPFEACDSFVRGFLEVLQKRNEGTIKIDHKLRLREDWLGQGIDWVQNYVCLSLPESTATLDFCEYYWDIFMVHEISLLGDAIPLLAKASQGAQQFYRRKTHLLKEAMDLHDREGLAYFRRTKFGRGDPEFPAGDYLRILGRFGTVLSKLWLFPPAAKIILVLAKTQVPILNQLVGAFVRLVEEAAQHLLGDVIRYLNLDPRSQHYETRQKILNGAVEEVRVLMKNYDQIIVAGHSLGSVIAYDALNRIIQQVNAESDPERNRKMKKEAEKIIGLVTFGSPLDKIAFAFSEYIPHADVRRYVLAHFHKFRARPLWDDEDAIKMGDPMQFALEKAVWLNFHHPQDLVSGRLDAYEVDIRDQDGNVIKQGNIVIKGKFDGLAAAHSCYWGADPKRTNQMYEDIVAEFFQ